MIEEKVSINNVVYIYLQVLFPGEPNVSRNRFADLHAFDASLVVYDGLDARIIKHIRH